MKVGSFVKKQEPTGVRFTEGTSSSLEAEADRNGPDRSVFTWRDRVLAKAGASKKVGL